MRYRLLLFRFYYNDAKYLFPIIINFEETAEVNLIRSIITELRKVPGCEKVDKIFDREDSYENLKDEFNEMIGEINLNNIQSIDLELRKSMPINLADYEGETFQKFKVKQIHLPIRKLNNFNEFNFNPFIVLYMD